MARIMLIDDDQNLRELVGEVLEADGHRVETFEDGRKAVAALAAAPERRPDLIIADVMMPEMDGFTFHNELQEDPKTRDIPIIIITAYPRLYEVFAKVAVVKEFLLKPVEARVLRDAVSRALRPA